jgi:dipeptidyl aminopeptidase/acylaminoacyl peptidase/CubicO group peptidase (beta-lactamase class C family)
MGRRLAIDDIYDLRIPTEVAISPDGALVAYTLRSVDREADADRRALWLVRSDGGEPVQLTRGKADTAPAWSPDGTQLAFLRGGDGPAQIWLLPAAGGEPRRLTSLPLGAGAPVWSPDGTRLAFIAPVDLAADGGKDGGEDGDEAARERRAAAPIVVDRLGYKADGAGLLRGVRQHLFVVAMAGGETRRLTDGDWHAGVPAWSPDGGRLAFAAAMAPDADLTGESAAYVVELGEELDGPRPAPRLVGDAHGTAGRLTWAPDGAALLVVGRRDTRTGNAGLLRVPLDGGAPADLLAALDRNVMPGGPAYPGGPPQVTADGRTVVLCARDRGCTHVYTVDLAGGEPRKLIGGADRTVAGLSVARDADRCAVVLCDPRSFGEVAVADLAGEPAGGPAGSALGRPQALTDHTLPDVELLTATEREFEISDGTVVHGWLLRDPEATSPGPLLLDVHGGPHNAWSPVADAVHAYHQVLAARGWSVLTLNVRGSDGYGEAFITGGLGAWGEADQRDFMEPLDRLVAEGVADPARLALCGYSYGGFMTCFLTSRTDRFAAAVAGGVVSDLTSMAGTSDMGHFIATRELDATTYGRPERYAAMSPHASVGRVTTPTLILHGGADERCPVGQAEQWFAALRERGVPTRMVLYPGGSHLFILEGRPSHRADYCRRIVDWVSRHGDRKPGVPPRARVDADHWGRRLAELALRHKVPGAALGILRADPDDPSRDEQATVAYGVLSKATAAAVTPDSLFQTGSICKSWTATMVMRLVDDGELDLDQPIVELLPELRLGDAEVASKVTMRHLLTHTSGIDGDVFTDTGRGDDCVERYVALLDRVGQNHPLGATFSYCNSGYIVAGRIIEKVTGLTWDAAMRERLFKPLGLDHTVTLPEEALLFRAAVGHVGADPRPAPVWALPRSSGPAGATLNSTVGDMLAFARMHLAGGSAADGTQVLSPGSAAAMQERQVDLPDTHSLGDSWGLGWIRYGWSDHRLVGHDGNTVGQSAFLRLLPEQGLAVTLLTNGGNTRDLYHDLYREIFAELGGVDMPRPLAPPASPPSLDPSPYLGTYERASVRTEVFERDGRLLLRTTVTSPELDLVPEERVKEHELVAVGDGLYALRAPGVQTWTPVRFYQLADGTPYVHYGGRANPKMS